MESKLKKKENNNRAGNLWKSALNLGDRKIIEDRKKISSSVKAEKVEINETQEKSKDIMTNENQIVDDKITEKNETQFNQQTRKICLVQKKTFILLTIIGVILICALITAVIYWIIPHRKPPVPPVIDIKQKDNEGGVKNEFEMNTETGDVKLLSVKQRAKEETTFNSKKIGTDITRISNYAVYINSGEKPTAENKKYYSNMHSGIVAIESECTVVDGEDCEPKPLVDLSAKSNLRLLSSENLRDIPIPVCKFNITDNHIITTMICPESLPDNKRNEIILDLYFFRPPLAERVDKERDNIKLTETKEENKTKIHETNGGYCNIYNNWGSQCTTDMTTVLDEKGNLLTYDEQAITKITYDEKNSYFKDKVTQLIDVSKNKKGNVNYKNTLEDLLKKLDPYMKEEIQFNQTEYEDLYNVIQEAKTSNKENLAPKKRRNTFRYLNYNLDENKFTKLAKLFSNKITPVEIEIDFKINPGLNSNKIGAYGMLKLDDQEFTYTSLEENFNVQEIIDKLSTIGKAGNYLASKLVDEIYNKFEQMVNHISLEIGSLDNLLMYYDLYKVFNSTLIELSYRKLPSQILDLSEQLVRALTNIYNNIKSGDIKQYVGMLYDDVYNYIHNLHELIKKMFDNLSSLSNVLLKKETTYTRITNYYLNNTSASYYNIIYRIQIILGSYYINEYERIYPKIQELLLLIGSNTDEALKNELEALNNLYNNIKNKNLIIESITDTELNTVLSNLDKSYIYPTDIIQEIEKYIMEIINIKDNGYFTSEEEKNNFVNSFTIILQEANEVAKQLENVDMIDKVFDNIMIKFREGYMDTVKLMEDIKTGNFTLDEDILKESLFTKEEKTKTENDLKKICDDIIEKIKNEKDLYTTKIHAYLNMFFNLNIDTLDDKILELVVIISEEAIKNIQQSFEISLNSSLDKLNEVLNENINLSKQYFDKYYQMVTDTNELKRTLLNAYLYHFGNSGYWYTLNDQPYMIYIVDEINGAIKRTSAYLSKYNKFMDNYNETEEYLKEQLYFDFVTEYREVFTKIKEELQSIIDHKLPEKFKNFDEFNSFEKHVSIIDNLKSRIDKYFSLVLFEEKYSKMIKESINLNIEKITSVKNYINSKHDKVKEKTAYREDSKDICVSFYRKTCYGCTNCVEYVFFFDNYCFDLSPYEYNYLKVKKVDYGDVFNFDEFKSIYNNFNSKINEQVNGYNSIIMKFNLNITIIKEEIIKEKITENYLKPLNDWVNSILSQKYGETILTSVYNYYKSNLDDKLEKIFSDIFKQWKKIYDNLASDVRKNDDNLKYSMFEFSYMADIYNTIIQTDLMENYYNSIILFEQSQVNYAISYYYSFFYKLIDKYYKYIIRKIPTNGDVYNDLLSEKKLELENNFENINIEISKSEKYYLSTENQTDILKIDEDDYFKNKFILTKTLKNLNETLDDIIDEIMMFEMFIFDGNEYSLVMRYYLENKELGKLIERLYEPIDNGEFFYLEINKFKDIVVDNWIFDKESFANVINNILYETGVEIKKELNVKIKEYTVLIQNELNEFFSDIENAIYTLFKSTINSMTNSQRNKVNSIILELISGFETRMISEAGNIDINSAIYSSNGNKIKNYIQNYKDNIKKKIESSIFELLDTFKDNVYEHIYTNIVEEKTKIYLNSIKDLISKFDIKNYNLLNATFNIGEKINNLVETIINNYKTIVSKTIYNRYLDYYGKIKLNLNLEVLYIKIDNELDRIYNNILLPKLQNGNKCRGNNCQEYGFSVETTNYLDNFISNKINDIKNEIIIVKGNKAKIDIEINIDIKITGINIYEGIFNSLKSFLSFENEEQVSRINEIIQNVIKTNLEDFLYDIIPTYGNIFFERIIDYNINFKIVNLYENLHYGISKTLLYYHLLRVLNSKMHDLPYDLKIRLYRLNDLDITVLNKVEDIKILAEKKLSELILDLRNETRNIYISLKNDENFRNKFSPQILEKIDNNLEKIMPDLEKTYQKVLEKYLKEKFMKSFSEILDEKTDYMIKIFYEEKQKLIERLDDLFSSKEDKDLNEVNKNINITIESMRTYRRFLSTFKISDEVINFFASYSENTLLPLYRKFFSDLNEQKDELIKSEINTRSYEIENLDPLPYREKMKEIYDRLFENYFKYINNSLYEYGVTEQYYENNLNKTKTENKDGSSEIVVRRESKYVEDNLNKLVFKATNVKQYVNTLPAFTDTENIINEYKNRLNIDYKDIKDQISQNKYSDTIDAFLKDKLYNLTIILNNYYDTILFDFSTLKYQVTSSISDIKDLVDTILDITAKIMNKQYKAISDSTVRIDKTINIDEEHDERMKYIQKTENMMTTVRAYIEKIKDYAEFKFDFTLDGNKFKIPKIKSTIIDKIIPKDIEIIVATDYSFCYNKSFSFNFGLTDGNFTSVLEFDTKSSLITINTYTNIEGYKYTIKQVEIKGYMNTEVINVENYFYKPFCTDIVRNITAGFDVDIPDIIENKTDIINK